MKRRNRQSTVLDACSDSANRGISRRQFVQTGAGVIAAGTLLGKRAFATPRPLKIGYVSPETGALAPFGEADAFIIDGFRKIVQGGIQAGGTTRPVEILVRDSQSHNNRCAEVAASLIKTDKIDLMLVAGTADTVNPASDQCEINQVPCVSTDALWEATYFVRGGTPFKGFDWTYHFFFGAEMLAQANADLFDLLPTNKVVGLLLGNDAEGMVQANPQRGCPPIFAARGYKVVDPGRFDLDMTDFSAQISGFKNANAEVLYALLPLPTFSNFWAQAAQQGYKPKVALIGKALLFPSAVESLGPRGKYLTVTAWWTPGYPFKSSLTSLSSRQLCDQYEEVARKQWTQVLGFRHALFEMAADVFKRAQNPESAASVIEAVRTTRLNTIAGPLQWQGPPPNEWTKMPFKNVCTTPIAPAQWVPGKKWMYDLIVVDNHRFPPVPVERKMEPLPG